MCGVTDGDKGGNAGTLRKTLSMRLIPVERRENGVLSTKQGYGRHRSPTARHSKTSASVNATPSWSLPDRLGA